MTFPRKIRVKKTPYGLHLYTASIKESGWYGFGDTPEAARSKLLELIASDAHTKANPRNIFPASPCKP